MKQQVSVRMVLEAPLLSDEKIQNPQDVIRILGAAFKDYDREVYFLKKDVDPDTMS